MKLHKIVEAIDGPVLIVVPWAMGLIIITVGFLTDYFETNERT